MASLHENNIALAKALAKQKEVQKDIKELEATNNVLKTKCKMCARQFKEMISVMDEHLDLVLAQASTFFNSLVALVNIVDSQKQRNEALLQMIENDDIAEVSGPAISKTQLVNPMVAGHTLKKASIALRRLDMANLNLARNNAPEEDGGTARVRPHILPRTNEADEDMPLATNGAANGPSLTNGTIWTGSHSDDDSDLDQEVSVIEDSTANRRSLRNDSMLANSTLDGDTSAIMDVSIQSRLPRHTVYLPFRVPTVSLERLNMFCSSGSRGQEVGQSNADGVAASASSSSSFQTSETLDHSHSGIGDNNSSRVLSPDIICDNPPPRAAAATTTTTTTTVENVVSHQYMRKLTPRVNLVDIRNTVINNKASTSQNTSEDAGCDVIYCQEISRLTPRVNLVDIGNTVKTYTSQKTSVDGVSSDVIYSHEVREFKRRTNLEDTGNIGTPSKTTSAQKTSEDNNVDVICCQEISKLTPRVNLVDIGNSVKSSTSHKASADAGDVIYCQEVKKLSPRVSLVDIGNKTSICTKKPSESSDGPDVICCQETSSNSTPPRGGSLSASNLPRTCQQTGGSDVVVLSGHEGSKLVPRVSLVNIGNVATVHQKTGKGLRPNEKTTPPPIGIVPEIGKGQQSVENSSMGGTPPSNDAAVQSLVTSNTNGYQYRRKGMPSPSSQVALDSENIKAKNSSNDSIPLAYRLIGNQKKKSPVPLRVATGGSHPVNSGVEKTPVLQSHQNPTYDRKKTPPPTCVLQNSEKSASFKSSSMDETRSPIKSSSGQYHGKKTPPPSSRDSGKTQSSKTKNGGVEDTAVLYRDDVVQSSTVNGSRYQKKKSLAPLEFAPAVVGESRLSENSIVGELSAPQSTEDGAVKNLDKQPQATGDGCEEKPSGVDMQSEVFSFTVPLAPVRGTVLPMPQSKKEEDPLEGPSWLYDPEDSRSSQEKRKHCNISDTLFIPDSSDEESPYVVKKKAKRVRPRSTGKRKMSKTTVKGQGERRSLRPRLCQTAPKRSLGPSLA